MVLRLKKVKSGAALVEYGMLVGLISVVGIAAVFNFGLKVENTFSVAASGMMASGPSVSSPQPHVPDLTFSFIAGHDPQGPGYTGYNGHFTIQFGTGIITQTSVGEVMGIHMFGSNSLLRMGGNRPLSSGARVTCNGAEYVIPTGSYISGSDYTNYQWPGGAGRPVFTDGIRYDCFFTE